ncbi:glycosyltransferase [uncultured Sphingomonas sp.]|uniref:glycosyltransferase n=1 Tax=uncultured Sphingomonas sp. TaxID=158754 RepID=UPI0035CA3C71
MILFITRIPPNANGHGGSQRAMHILKSLAKLDTVDLLLIHRTQDLDSVQDDLRQVEGVARTCHKVQLNSWEDPQTRWPFLTWRTGRIASLVAPYSIDAPRVATSELRRVAARLPVHDYDVVFAGRVTCAVVVDKMLAKGMLTARRKVLDLDDVMSRFKERELEVNGPTMGRLLRFLNRTDVKRLQEAERRALGEWDAVSVCTDEDVAALKVVDPEANLVRMSNVTDKAALSKTNSPSVRLLFVGSLRFQPNVHGLRLFLQEAWPLVRERVSDVTLDIVGMSPSLELRAEIEAAGARLHADVPSVEPFYRDTDIVIAPIDFGSGTRIKIVEAMAYGRAMVASTIGAEGLHIEPGVHALIADEMPDFADAVVRLARDPALRNSLATQPGELQQRFFSPQTIEDNIAAMVAPDRAADLDIAA